VIPEFNGQIKSQTGLKEARPIQCDVLQRDFVIESYSIVNFESSRDWDSVSFAVMALNIKLALL
jgi:hypothetical protein